MIGGKIKKLESKLDITIEEQSLLIKYFHIVEKGQGHGTFWLNSCIIPYYKQKNYKQIYVNSSHKASFPFYERIGQLISKYEQQGVNCLNIREGRCYQISI